MATAAQNMASMMIVTESQRRIDALSEALTKMQSTTYETSACCDRLTRRARHLDSLTSPASDASATLTQASSHLTSTLALMKDARDKYDTVADCEPAIERLLQGATEALEARQKNSSKHESKGESANSTTGGSLTEQDVYAAADSMEIIRDAYNYFQQRPKWRSTPSALGSLERVHLRGVDAMCILVTAHLSGAGPAVRIKRVVMDSKANHTAHKNETSAEVSIH
jgi:exocyst complex protein 7